MATELRTAAQEKSEPSVSDDGSQKISLPRRIVYFQAALLGVIATTFFVFGMMVGTLTSRNQMEQELGDCTVSGRVVWDSDGRRIGDQGAVVLLLPLDKVPDRRLNPNSIHPDQFEPIDNSVIESILELGGAVVRTNSSGDFDVQVNSPAKYSLVVVSHHQTTNRPLEKKEMAALSSYFRPVDDIRSGKSVHVQAIRLDSKDRNLGEIRL